MYILGISGVSLFISDCQNLFWSTRSHCMIVGHVYGISRVTMRYSGVSLGFPCSVSLRYLLGIFEFSRVSSDVNNIKSNQNYITPMLLVTPIKIYEFT